MNTDDPRLTAYALDELPPAERAEIEALLAADATCAAEVKTTRNLAAQLRVELHAEEDEPLSPGQRSRVLAIARTTQLQVKPADNFRTRLGSTTMMLAAILVLAALVGMLFFPASVLRQGNPAAEPREHFVAADGELTLPSVDLDGVTKDQAPVPTPTAPLLAATTTNQVQWSPQPGMITSSGTTHRERDFAGGYWNQPRTAAAFDYGDSNDTNSALAPSNPVGAAPIPADPSSNRTASAGGTTYSIREGNTLRFTGTFEKADKDASQLGSDLTKSGSGSLAIGGTNTFTGATTINGGALGASGFGGRIVSSEGIDSGKLDSRRNTFESGTRIYDSRFDERAERGLGTETYDAITDNAFLPVKDNPLSTFSIDVDTASYANVRRFLHDGALPPRGAVRIEEMVNYFPFDYPQPAGDAPFSATMEVAACPWAPAHRLVRIGLKGKDVARSERPATNLVFLIDVSGSMQPANRLPLVKESLRLLIDQLDDRDQVALAVYAGASGTVLEPTRDKSKMRAALDRLQAGGSTNGAGGIQLAYELAAKSFIKGGTNRVILATDGDFNVGITSQSELVDLIEKKAKTGVFLSVLGYGMGNLKDSTLEKLADKGNGNYGYIDTLAEARKTLVEQMNGTLHTIAKDVKIQVEFNPAQAAAYRLIGYENRVLAKEDFNDDKKDAGEIGAGHSVTALYEVVPAGSAAPGASPAVDELKYSAKPSSATAADHSALRTPHSAFPSPELLTLKLRYKKPDGDVSAKLEFPLTDRGETWEKSSPDFRWAAAVASFGMMLRESPHKGGATWDSTLELAHEGRGEDRTGYRAECIALIEKARTLRP